MKHFSKELMAVSLTAILALCLKPVVAGEVPSSKEEQVSYSLGHRMGVSIKKQHLDVDIDSFVQAVRDVLSGNESLMTNEEMNASVTAYFKARKEKAEREREALAAKNLEEGEAFLAENAKKEGVVVLPSGLQYKVVESGSGRTPELTNKVSVHFRGTKLDGAEFGNTYTKNEPVTFWPRGVIAGWTEALQLMKEGDKWQLWVPANLAYGEQGDGRTIGPNEALTFDIELVEVIDAEPPVIPDFMKPKKEETKEQAADSKPEEGSKVEVSEQTAEAKPEEGKDAKPQSAQQSPATTKTEQPL